MSREEILKRKRENSKRLRSSPEYRSREAKYSKGYRESETVKKKRVKNQINYERLKKYNLTAEDYNHLLEDQKFSCKICLTHLSQLDRNLAVDHDHQTGLVRGLLCLKCNLGLGYFNDNPDLLKNASAYLERNN